jgi:nicotinamidase-related amidase
MAYIGAMADASDAAALIVIDIQKDYFPAGRNPVVGAEAAAKVAQQMLEKFREKHQPIVHVQHISLRPNATFFLPGTPGIEFSPLVAPRTDEIVVQKHYPNSFRETSLLDEVRSRQVTHLFFCGMMTHMCIDTTVRAAFDLGFQSTVFGNATATKDLSHGGITVPAAQVQAAYLAGLSGLFATVI